MRKARPRDGERRALHADLIVAAIVAGIAARGMAAGSTERSAARRLSIGELRRRRCDALSYVCCPDSDVPQGTSAIHLERCDERFLRDFHLAELPQALLALFLLVEELALAGRVAAIAFRRHVLAQRPARFRGR